MTWSRQTGIDLALADWHGVGDTEMRWRARLSTVRTNLVARSNGEPTGMASGTAAAHRGGTIEPISMWVAPFARGRGVGYRRHGLSTRPLVAARATAFSMSVKWCFTYKRSV
ncbi:MAG: GNAT family N-acetyltransferase [Candidatus Eremiobacteraeota bacterium]|nr:GNAT family N-acetyltransferase [Candidatus Eremiobacteraeota bacterium]